MAAQAVDLELSANFAEQDCDHLLDLAGMPKRWLPGREKLEDADLLVLGAQVLAYTAFDHLNESAIDDVEEFGSVVANYTAGLFPGEKPPSYTRTERAIDKQRGNCIAAQEAVSGVLTACGLGEYAVAFWNVVELDFGTTYHASNGLLTADRATHIDGYTSEVSLLSPSDPLTDIYRTVVNTGQAVVYSKNSGDAKDRREVDVAELNTVDLRNPGEGQTIALPAPYAILMMEAVRIGKSQNPRHAQAQNILSPFAPVH